LVYADPPRAEGHAVEQPYTVAACATTAVERCLEVFACEQRAGRTLEATRVAHGIYKGKRSRIEKKCTLLTLLVDDVAWPKLCGRDRDSPRFVPSWRCLPRVSEQVDAHVFDAHIIIGMGRQVVG